MKLTTESTERATPETDKAIKYWPSENAELVDADFARRLERERDEAREALADWENASAHVEANHPDEVHCGCVPVLRKLLIDARKERDEAREALMEVEDRCVDCEDACEDIQKIRDIAAKALEVVK